MLVVEVICSCHSAMTKKAYETAKIGELLPSPRSESISMGFTRDLACAAEVCTENRKSFLPL